MNQNHPIQKIKNFIHKLQSEKATKKYGNPGNKLKLIGVTGTDGKTTVSTMIYHVLKSAGKKVGYISTINAKIGEEVLDTGLHVTTPDPWDVPRYLNLMVESNVEFAILESTSSGLEQNRLHGLEFDTSVITNIKYDHLDYHGTWENYANAKYRLLEMTKKDGKIVLNEDDSKSAAWLKKMLEGEVERNVVWVGTSKSSNEKHSIDGLGFTYLDKEFRLPIIGRHNFLNTLQTIEVCRRYLRLDEIAESLKTFTTPEGRMEIIQTRPFTIIVDFAHTPKALESALESLNDIRVPNSRLITVFGCAGKRDKGRREMGAISAKLSDVTILTAEDPRDEKLVHINSEIFSHSQKVNGVMLNRFPDHESYIKYNIDREKEKLSNMLNRGEKPVVTFDEDTIRSREDAIEYAIKIARSDDIVFITGKGHEKSLAFGPSEEEFDWSDQKTVRKILSLS